MRSWNVVVLKIRGFFVRKCFLERGCWSLGFWGVLFSQIEIVQKTFFVVFVVFQIFLVQSQLVVILMGCGFLILYVFCFVLVWRRGQEGCRKGRRGIREICRGGQIWVWFLRREGFVYIGRVFFESFLRDSFQLVFVGGLQGVGRLR